MHKEPIKIVVIDNENENEFYEFIKECITLEALSFYGEDCECIEVEHSNQHDISSFDYDIYVVVEQDNEPNSADEVVSLINYIRNKKGLGPHIFVVTRNSNPILLKKLIEVNITGLIDKDEKDCSVLAKSMHRAFETRTAICKICELKDKIEKI